MVTHCSTLVQVLLGFLTFLIKLVRIKLESMCV
jgi:hypothetical protein